MKTRSQLRRPDVLQMNLAALMIGFGSLWVLIGFLIMGLAYDSTTRSNPVIAVTVMSCLGAPVSAGIILASIAGLHRRLWVVSSIASLGVPVLVGTTVLFFFANGAPLWRSDIVKVLSAVGFIMAGVSAVVLIAGLAMRSYQLGRMVRLSGQVVVLIGITFFLVTGIAAAISQHDGNIDALTMAWGLDSGPPSILIGIVSILLLPFTIIEIRFGRDPANEAAWWNRCCHCNYDRRYSSSPLCPECGKPNDHHR